MAAFSVSLNAPNFVGWSLRNFALSGAAIRAKFGTNLRNTLHSPKKDFSSVIVDGSFKPRIASVV